MPTYRVRKCAIECTERSELSALYAARALHSIVRESPAVTARPTDE